MRIHRSIGNQYQTRRDGKQTHEYLAQVSFIRYENADGDMVSQCRFAPPLPLTQGKTAIAIFSAGRKFGPTLRQLGHRGIVIQHYCFDRACLSSVGKLCLQEHRKNAKGFGATPAESTYLEQLEWSEMIGCALHDAHNALKWGLHQQCSDRQFMKDLWKVFQALRNSYDLILKYVCPWLIEHVAWTEEANCPPMDELQDVWDTLGLDPVLSQLMVEEMRMRWDPQTQRLHIKSDWQRRPNAMDDIATVLLGVWRFKQFSDSRWVTIGCNSRSIVAGLLTGLDSLVGRIRADPLASDYEIKGWEKFDTRAKRFVVVASVASYVSDSVLSIIFEDSRVPRQAPQLREALEGELKWLETMDSHTWAALGSVFTAGEGVSAWDLRAEILGGAHLAAGYFNWECLSEVDKYPWCLATNPDEGLAELRARESKPDQPAAGKIWDLLRAGFSTDKIKTALELLLDCPWSTAATEQAHAMGAVIKRLHHELCPASLVARAMIGGFRKLLPARTIEERQIDSLRTELRNLEKKNPSRMQARQVFFGELMGLSTEWLRSGRLQQGANRHVKIMAGHGQLFKKLKAKDVAQLEHKAKIARSKSFDKLVEEKDAVRARLRLAIDRMELQRASRPCLSLTACKFDQPDMSGLQQQWKACRWTEKQVKQRMDMLLAAPNIVSDSHQKELQQQDVPSYQWMNNPGAARPAWLAEVVHRHSEFKETVWCLQNGGLEQYYKLLFIVKSPYQLYFEQVEKANIAGGAGGALPAIDALGKVGAGDWKHRWIAPQLALKDWSQLPLQAGTTIKIYPQAVCVGRFTTLGYAEPVLLHQFVDGIPLVAQEPAEPAEKRPRPAPKVQPQTFTPEQLAQFPWLAKSVGAPKKAAASAGAAGSCDVPSGEEEDIFAAPVLTEEQLLQLYNELERKRAEAWEQDLGHIGGSFFKISILGGELLMKASGKSYDAVRCFASGKACQTWCTKYNLQQATRFDTEFYGESEAITLAITWGERMGYFYSLWLNQANPDYMYTQADFDNWSPHEAFAKLKASLKGKQLKRVEKELLRFPRL